MPTPLPPFNSTAGELVRSTCRAPEEFLAIAKTASELSEPRYDWLHWATTEGCGLFPHNQQLLMSWLNYGLITGNIDLIRRLRALLGSFGPTHEIDARAALMLVRADIAVGRLDAAIEVLKILQKSSDADPSKAWAEALDALIAAGRFDEAGRIAETLVQHSNPLLRSAISRALVASGAYGLLITQVDNEGGLSAATPIDSAYNYLASLESIGRLGDAFARGVAYLNLSPENAPVAHLMRHLAMRLDRLAEVTPLLRKAAVALAAQPEGLELSGLVALDADDYAAARRILALLPEGEQASRLRLNIALTDPGTSRRERHRAYVNYRSLRVGHAGPEMQYAAHLFNEARSSNDLAIALSVARSGLPVSGGNPYFHRLFLSLLIANGDIEQALTHLNSLPPALRASRLVAEVVARFSYQNGREQELRERWRSPEYLSAFRATQARTEPALPVATPGRLSARRVVVFCVVFNGADYLPSFLSHYRSLGVAGFVFVDNGSTDGTAATLACEPDVLLYSQPCSFREAAHGVAWINPLIQLHAANRWALFVDIDEHFTFPNRDRGLGLDHLVEYAEAAGAGCFPSFMLDMFAPGRARVGDISAHVWFDPIHVAFPSVLPPYRAVQGGLRGRMTGRQFLLTKSPLVRVEPDLLFLENNHLHTHLRPCEVTTTLLHYKFLGESRVRFEEAVSRGEHFLGGRLYRDMLRRLGGGIRRGLWARRYRGERQLVRLGLMLSSAEWDRAAAQLGQ